MAREISAGGVVLRHMQGRWFLAAIEPRRENHPTPGARKAAVLALPKGIVDPGERPEQTALREVREETGVEAELITKLNDIRYVYVRTWGDHARVFKIVSFYLLRYTSGKLGELSPEMRHEVKSASWVPLDEAVRKLSYKGERDVAELALKYLQAHAEELKL